MFLLSMVSAWAFPVADHRALTEAAVTATGLEAHRRQIVHGAVWEDLDLFTKWTRWSHYDNPSEPIRGRRRRSAERVDHLWTDVVRDLARSHDRRAWRRVGRIVHQVQDMAVPAHVVPIQHGPFDGFEQFAGRVIPDVGAVVPRSPAEVHHDVAWDTWTAVQGTALFCDREVPWTTVWIPRAGRFGTFGEPRFGTGEDCGAFAAFDADRVRSALTGTAAILDWMASQSVR